MAFSFLFFHKYLAYHISESQLNRRIRQINCWNKLLQTLTKYESHYVVDSFSISSCRLSREQSSKLFHRRQFKGYNASHKTFFHGLKGHLIISKIGAPFIFQITPGSEHDLTALKFMNLSFHRKIYLYADKAYNDFSFEKSLIKTGVRLIPQRTDNYLNFMEKTLLQDLKNIEKE